MRSQIHSDICQCVLGSFGTYPVEIRSVLRHFQDQSEARPDTFIRYEYPEGLDGSRKAVADYLHAPVDACVFVDNATTSVNTVLRNLVFKPGDVIIYFATIYGACEKTVSYILETTPAQAKKIEYHYPVSDDFLCNSFESAVQEIRREGKNPLIAIFDTIVSLPGVRVPFERLTKLCKQHNVLSCIDGAHGIGHIPLNLSELDPDFLVSNCHKWLYTPRGSAIFYVPVRNQHLMRSTLPTSHGFVPKDQGSIKNPLPPSAKSEFVNNFEFVGTHDNSPYLTVQAALEWRSKVTWNRETGEEAVIGYMQHLARQSGIIVSSILKTEVLENEEGTLGMCSFSNVRLPLSFAEHAGSDELQAIEIGQWISKTSAREFRTFIVVIFFGGAWWTRLSAQIYLTEKDFEWAGKVLSKTCARVRRGEWKDRKLSSKL